MSTVVNFPKRSEPGRTERLPDGWRNDELQQIVSACSGSVSVGEASGWEIGTTEGGDPQVYLIGPPPGYDCILCISRVGRHYVIEDGHGRVLLEHDSPMLLAEQALAALRRRKAALLAQIAVAWHAFREAFEEKTEALTAEPMEVLAHLAPQLAALA
jgi:hypothetical protein